jgi:uncharacterized protein YwgA
MIKSLLKVGDVIEAMKGIPDRLALQKTIYLLQKMGLEFGYQYKWYTLGPYSSDLANDMFEGLSINAFNASDEGYSEFETGSTYRKLRERIPSKITEDTTQVEKLVAILGKDIKNSTMLECIGSLLFLKDDEFSKLKTQEEVFSELEKLKPKKFRLSVKEKAWNYLIDLGFVK